MSQQERDYASGPTPQERALLTKVRVEGFMLKQEMTELGLPLKRHIQIREQQEPPRHLARKKAAARAKRWIPRMEDRIKLVDDVHAVPKRFLNDFHRLRQVYGDTQYFTVLWAEGDTVSFIPGDGGELNEGVPSCLLKPFYF